MRGSSASTSSVQAAAALLHVDDRLGPREHDVGARDAGGPALLGVALGPGQRRAVGLRRVGGGEDDRRGLLGDLLRAQPLDRAGERELRAAEPLDEVAAAADAERLELLQRVVEDREAAGDPLGEHLLAGDDPVALEQQLGEHAASRRPAPAPCGRSCVDERPAALGRRARRSPCGASRSGAPGRLRLRARDLASVCFGARSGAQPSFVTSPAQTRSHSASCSCSGPIASSASRSVKKHGDSESRSRSTSCSGRSGRSVFTGGGPIASASSRKYSATRPLLRPIAPAPDPDDLARSRRAGRARWASRRRSGAGARRAPRPRRAARAPAAGRAPRAAGRCPRPRRGGGRSPASRAGRRPARAGRRPRSPCAGPPARHAAAAAGPRCRTTRARCRRGAARRGPASRRARATPASAVGSTPVALAQLVGGERAVGARRSARRACVSASGTSATNASGSPPGGTTPSASR